MGRQQQMYKSSEFIDESDDDILEITSSDTDTSSLSSSGSSTVFADRGTLPQVPMRDSIDRELDAMSPVPEPVPVPVRDPSPPPKQAAKPKKKKVSSKHSEAPPTEPKPIETVEPAREVTFNVLILPYSEIKKDDVKKWSGTSTILTLHLDEPFDTFKAQILCKIDKETSPATLSFDNYKVSRIPNTNHFSFLGFPSATSSTRAGHVTPRHKSPVTSLIGSPTPRARTISIPKEEPVGTWVSV
ncbi:uncharacterized protein EDB91DRAFT_1243204 [Suillus paluster]|uniref:uncharacterized protein n=1 Tax=Suillus paluster TaxID=48578 RepID=UPI001B8776F3|nr:uncharacterized protein EDB91DRAFT_1243204 [Suillus paluster]KAG1752436.1 hypothetical protein EDB91DRAFT_1243204 [Suillus paluster]